MFVGVFSVGGLLWAYFLRQKPLVVVGIGGTWLVLGIVYTALDRQPQGVGFLAVGVICLFWGGMNLLRARQAPMQPEE
jgi:hypothetical protein